jgi:hypothetical protein
MSAETVALELGPDGARIEWEPDSLRTLAAGESAGPAWRLEGELDWNAVESLRVVSAAFEDGRLLAVVAPRPAGAEGHDAAEPRGVLVQPDGEVVELAEALLSTEYDADGAPSRIGLELYPEPEGIPVRVAADREAPARAGDGSETTAMSFRMEGARGAGLFERISRT